MLWTTDYGGGAGDGAGNDGRRAWWRHAACVVARAKARAKTRAKAQARPKANVRMTFEQRMLDPTVAERLNWLALTAANSVM